jgi:hypothetical protein
MIDKRAGAWTALEDELLGRKSDEEIGRMLARTVSAVRARRKLLKIHKANPKFRYYTPADDKL